MTEPLTLDELLAAARATYDRVTPAQASQAHADGALLVDIRPEAQRKREGEIPGALIIERNVLEWRLAPTSDHRIDELTGPDQPVIIVCSQGYASSLAAATLRSLGLRNATDLIGGFLEWEAQGFPAVAFRHATPPRPRRGTDAVRELHPAPGRSPDQPAQASLAS